MDRYTKFLITAYFVLCILLLTPQIHGNDGIGYFVYLHSVVMDHDLDFTNEFAHYGNQYVIVGHSPVTGRPDNGVPIGSAILWLPFFLLAHVFVILSNLLGSTWSTDGYSFPYVFSVCFASSLYGLLGLLLIYNIAKRFFSEKVSFLSVLFFWLSSPLVFYMLLHPSMAHANSVFAVSFFLYLWFRIYWDKKDTWRDWAYLGFSAGLMIIVRLQDVLFLIVPAVYLIAGTRNVLSLRVSRNLVISLIFLLIAVFPQLYAWKSIFGSYFSGPESHQVREYLNLLNPHFLSVLFSGRHGLILWNPIIVFGIAGYGLFYRKDKILTISLFIVFLLQLWIVSSWHEWWGSHSFGHRMFLTSAPLFILGLCGFMEYLQQKLSRITFQRITIVVGILLVLWNFGLMFQYAANLIDRDGTTPFTQVMANQFTLVPQKLVYGLKQLIQQRFSS